MKFKVHYLTFSFTFSVIYFYNKLSMKVSANQRLYLCYLIIKIDKVNKNLHTFSFLESLHE